MNKIFIIVVMLFMLLASNVYAINLGSLVKDNSIELSAGETGKFKMLFWNAEDESYVVKLTVKDFPKEWIVIIDPSEFNLNRITGEEYISLPHVSDNVKAKVVDIFVKPSDQSKSSKYYIVIRAETETLESGYGEISVIPERLFKFEVNLRGFTTDFVQNKEAETPEKYVGYESDISEPSSQNNNQLNKDYVYAVIVFLIILFSIIIYKK